MTDNLILWELQKITEELTKTKDEHTLNFRMMRPTERFHFNEPMLNTSKLGLIRLSVYKSVFIITEKIIGLYMLVRLVLYHLAHMR